MSEKMNPGPIHGECGIKEAVCIHTKKIYDSCRDKDCLENLRVYPTRASQNILDRAMSVRSGKAELLDVCMNVEPASYNRGFYSVDIRYYYRVTADAFVGCSRPAEVSGLAVFDKRVILFGSEGNAKVFSSRCQQEDACCVPARTNMPEAAVEAVDPIVLSMKLTDGCQPCNPCSPCQPCQPCGSCGSCDPCQPCGGSCGQSCNPCQPNPCDPCNPPACPIAPCGCAENELTEIPNCISACFDCELTFDNSCRRLYVTLGQFSIVRLERDSQLLMPMYDYCMPTRECSRREEEPEDDPCEIFRQIRFPVGEFFPPNSLPGMDEDAENSGCGCGC